MERQSEKFTFFSDTGKSQELKRIILKLCEGFVSESDELPKYQAAARNLLVKTETLRCLPQSAKLTRMF